MPPPDVARGTYHGFVTVAMISAARRIIGKDCGRNDMKTKYTVALSVIAGVAGESFPHGQL
jgi:hypothetical protein